MVFSEFEVKKTCFKFKDAAKALAADCTGSLEEEMTSKTVTKKCRGVTVKSVTKGTGEGTLNIALHIPYEIYKEGLGMELETLKDGVLAYGSNSVHKEFCYTNLVEDEDGNEKLKAYPHCTFANKPTVTIENGAEEVALVEGTINVTPDEYGNGVYEALSEGLVEDVKTAWLENFTPALVQVASA